ncbi:MAG: TIGR02300 family protein [Pacificimonas sp.]|nr:TIGR02300 family protein [Pacificimonas sp.]
MAKEAWGTKRQCPECSERFYDLGKDEPVTCIECGHEWVPEPVLKSKQPLPFDTAKTTKEKEAEESSDVEDLDIDEDDEGSPDDENDLGGDEDLTEVAKTAGDAEPEET